MIPCFLFQRQAGPRNSPFLIIPFSWTPGNDPLSYRAPPPVTSHKQTAFGRIAMIACLRSLLCDLYLTSCRETRASIRLIVADWATVRGINTVFPPLRLEPTTTGQPQPTWSARITGIAPPFTIYTYTELLILISPEATIYSSIL